MSDRPIIFSGPMVRAILDGRKTQHREALKEQSATTVWQQLMPSGCLCWFGDVRHEYGSSSILSLVVPGDRLWVCETLCAKSNDQGVRWYSYAADGRDVFPFTEWRKDRDSISSIHMPRWASRLTLIVEDVRVQRVQEISEEDARAEGVRVTWSGDMNEGPSKWADENFADLWNDLNAKRGFGWDANPWVVALTFRAVQKNIDEVKANE